MIEQGNSLKGLKVNTMEAFKVEIRHLFMSFWSYLDVAIYGTNYIWEFPDIKQNRQESQEIKHFHKTLQIVYKKGT